MAKNDKLAKQFSEFASQFLAGDEIIYLTEKIRDIDPKNPVSKDLAREISQIEQSLDVIREMEEEGDES